MSDSRSLWQDPPQSPSLEQNSVHVWRVRISQFDKINDIALRNLSDEELANCKDMLPHVRKQFVVVRGCLRSILAAYLDSDPAALHFGTMGEGKPIIIQRCSEVCLEFNVSHSGDLGLIAVAKTPVGVDVEKFRQIDDFAEIARKFFSPKEYERLIALPDADRERQFFRTWAAKEAYVKATGCGMSQNLARFEIEVRRSPERQMPVTDYDNADQPPWFVSELAVGKGYSAAVAFRCELPVNISCLRFRTG